MFEFKKPKTSLALRKNVRGKKISKHETLLAFKPENRMSVASTTMSQRWDTAPFLVGSMFRLTPS